MVTDSPKYAQFSALSAGSIASAIGGREIGEHFAGDVEAGLVGHLGGRAVRDVHQLAVIFLEVLPVVLFPLPLFPTLLYKPKLPLYKQYQYHQTFQLPL